MTLLFIEGHYCVSNLTNSQSIFTLWHLNLACRLTNACYICSCSFWWPWPWCKVTVYRQRKNTALNSTVGLFTWHWLCKRLYGWVNLFLVSMQCTENSGCFPRGKRTATIRRYQVFDSSVQCFPLCIPPTVMRILLRQFEMGSLTSAHLWVMAVLTKGRSGTHKYAQELPQRDRKAAPFSACPAKVAEPMVFGIEFRCK